jgi:hypothetical protein
MTSLKRQFLIFNYKNPQLWYWIDRFALERARAGWQHYGISNVIERARWETAIPTDGDIYKINNNHRAHYARMWMLKHPEHNGFFRTRWIPDDNLPDAHDYGPPREK